MRTFVRSAALLSIAVCWLGCGSTGPDTKAPETPQGFARTGGGDGENAFSWTGNREKDLAGYNLYRTADDPVNPFVLIATISPENMTYVDRGLDYTIQFFYKLTAFDDSGNESEATEPIVAIAANLSAPASPQNVHAAAQNMTVPATITVSWSPNSEGDLAEYRVYRSLTAGVATTGTPHRIVPAGTTTLLDTAEVGTKHFYKVIAADKGDLKSIASQSMEVSDVPLPVPALGAPANNATAASLTPSFTWAAVSQAQGYVLIVSTDPAGLSQIWSATVSGTTTSVTYSGTALTSGAAYHWRVVTTTVDPSQFNSISKVWKFIAP